MNPNGIFETLVKTECRKMGLIGSIDQLEKRIKEMIDDELRDSEKTEKQLKSWNGGRKKRAQG